MAFSFSEPPDLSLLQEEEFELCCWMYLLFAVQVCAVEAAVLLLLLTVLKASC